MPIDIIPIVAEFLKSVGVSVSASLITDQIKSYLADNPNPTREGLEQHLQNKIDIDGLDIRATKIVDFLAERGVINISGTKIYSEQGIVMGTQDGQLWFGDNSASRTKNTAIEAHGQGTGIKMTGNTAVVQHEDGSISFHVGKGSDK